MQARDAAPTAALIGHAILTDGYRLKKRRQDCARFCPATMLSCHLREVETVAFAAGAAVPGIEASDGTLAFTCAGWQTLPSR